MKILIPVAIDDHALRCLHAYENSLPKIGDKKATVKQMRDYLKSSLLGVVEDLKGEMEMKEAGKLGSG